MSMITLKEKATRGNLREYADVVYRSACISHKIDRSKEAQHSRLTVSDDMPQSAGADTAAPTVAASDDDDGGDPDPEPARRRSSPANHLPRAAQRNGTATAAAPSLPHPIDPLYRLPRVLDVTGIGRSSWWAGVKSGRYPAPVKIGERAVAWRASDIQNLIASFR